MHYAGTIANIRGERRVSYKILLRGPKGHKVRVKVEDFGSNSTLNCFATEGKPDAIEMIAKAYVALRRPRDDGAKKVECYLFETPDIVAFDVNYLE